MLGAMARIYVIGTETFSVCYTALITAVSGAGSDHVDEVNIIMLQHPLDLRFMHFQRFQLHFDLIGDVHIVGGVEVHASQSIHEESGDKAGKCGIIYRTVGQSGHEAAISG